MMVSKSLYRKWLEITISIHLKLVGTGVPGRAPCISHQAAASLDRKGPIALLQRLPDGEEVVVPRLGGGRKTTNGIFLGGG